MRRLGVSTIVANMLMITITLSLAAILVAWAGTSYGAFTGGTQLFFAQRGQALQERVVIENVYFNKTASPPQIFLFVRNVGVEDVKVVAIYVNGTALTPTGSGGSCQFTGSPAGRVLAVGEVCEFSLNWTAGWSSGYVFFIVVATARGNQVSTNARGP